jgi:hypothetical protein
VSKYLNINCYYVLRNNKLFETEFGGIKDHEVFLFNGSVSQDICDLLIVFGYKKMGNTYITEVHHSYDGAIFRITTVAERRLADLSEILF